MCKKWKRMLKRSCIKTKVIGDSVLCPFEDSLEKFIRDKRVIHIEYGPVVSKGGIIYDRALVIYKEKIDV